MEKEISNIKGLSYELGVLMAKVAEVDSEELENTVMCILSHLEDIGLDIDYIKSGIQNELVTNNMIYVDNILLMYNISFDDK